MLSTSLPASLSANLSASLLAGLLACAAPAEQDTQPTTPPAITSLALSCERETATWEIEVETSAWVSSATWWIAPPELPVETHSVRSRTASPAGDYERLALSLEQLSDPRLQENNSSTSALCPETQTAMRLAIFDPQSEDLAECWQWGGPLDWASIGLTEDCEIKDLWW